MKWNEDHVTLFEQWGSNENRFCVEIDDDEKNGQGDVRWQCLKNTIYIW